MDYTILRNSFSKEIFAIEKRNKMNFIMQKCVFSWHINIQVYMFLSNDAKKEGFP